MHITGNELTASSSVVAAIAIAGGYLGVRSANHNALNIAREERNSRREGELIALKRTTYANCLTKLQELMLADIDATTPVAAIQVSAFSKRADAYVIAANAVFDVELLAPRAIVDLARETLNATSHYSDNPTSSTRSLSKLRVAMRYELQNEGLFTSGELDDITNDEITRHAPGDQPPSPLVLQRASS